MGMPPVAQVTRSLLDLNIISKILIIRALESYNYVHTGSQEKMGILVIVIMCHAWA